MAPASKGALLNIHYYYYICMFGISRYIARLSLIKHDLHVGVVDISSPTTHRGEIRKDGAEIP